MRPNPWRTRTIDALIGACIVIALSGLVYTVPVWRSLKLLIHRLSA